MTRWMKVGAVFVALQLVGVLTYVMVERRRPEASASLGVGAPERMDLAAPSLVLERRDGSTFHLGTTGRRAVVHFWATWCAPCRAELPTFLAMEVPAGVDVLAASLDARWDVVERFMTLPMDRIALGRGAELARTLGDTVLPVTYVLDARGRIRLRYAGARDWSRPEVQRRLHAELAGR